MRFTGKKCEACGKVFVDTDDVVCCPVCGAPHHRSCWLESGRCASEAKHSAGYSWIMPGTEEKISSPAPDRKEETADGNVKFPDGTHSITCPHCGAENFPDDIYCRACHEQLKKEGLFDFSSEYNNDYYGEQQVNPGYQRQSIYNAYTVYGGLDPDSEIDGIPVREYADYIGKNSGNYIRKFSITEHFRKKTMWNWSAAVFGPIWFFYRKQTKIGAIMCAAIILLSALAGVLSMSKAVVSYVGTVISASQEYSAQFASGEITYEQMTDKVNKIVADATAQLNAAENTPRDIAAVIIEYLVFIGTAMFSGFYSNYSYQRKIKKEILDSREKCTDAQSYKTMLIARGGTSAGFALIGVVLQVAAYAITLYLPYVYVLLTDK